MSYTNFINKDGDCNYLNAQEKNADQMLLSCINKDSGINSNSNSSIFLNTKFDNVFSRVENFQNGGGDNVGNVEGFSNGGFSDSGEGKHTLNPGECPVGHTMDKNGCRQICTHCTYRDLEPESRSMNEADICEPEGTFNGFDNNGYIKCLRKDKKKEYLPSQAYTIDGMFFSDNVIHNLSVQRMY